MRAVETGVVVAGIVVVIAIGDAVPVEEDPTALDDDRAAVLDEEENPVPFDAPALEELLTDAVPA